VFVVEDDVSVRRAVHALIRSVGLQVEVFASAQEFLDRWQKDVPGCLVLDIRLPGLSGLDLQRRLLESDARIPIIFITGHGDIPMTVKAMKAGAMEVLPKPFRHQDLLDAIHAALDADRAGRAADKETRALRVRFASLTPREREVLSLVVSGRLNKQIAAAFGTKEATVKVQRGQMMRKMGADSVADLVRIAGRIGLSGSARQTSE
jgi:FixJ family two-component response regulator